MSVAYGEQMHRSGKKWTILWFLFVGTCSLSACGGDSPSGSSTTTSAAIETTTTVSPTTTAAIVSGSPAALEAVDLDSATTVPAGGARPTPHQVFELVAAELSDLGLPVRLPTSIDFLPPSDRELAVATLVSADSNGYVVVLGAVPGCAGGNACRLATFTSTTEIVELVGTAVTLANDLTGFYQDASCGATCSDGTVSWSEGPFTFTVGAKLSPGLEAAQIAWSTLADQGLPPLEFECDGDNSMSLQEASALPGTLWLVNCEQDSAFAEIVDPSASEVWMADLNDDSRDEVLVRSELGTHAFQSDVPPQAIMDQTTGSRLLLSDPRCADPDNSGHGELFDADLSTFVRFLNPVTVAPQDTTADLSGFDAC